MPRGGRRGPSSNDPRRAVGGICGCSARPVALPAEDPRRRKKLGRETGGFDRVEEGSVEVEVERMPGPSLLDLLEVKLIRRGVDAVVELGVEDPLTLPVELSVRLPRRLPRLVVRRRRDDERWPSRLGSGGGELKCGVLDKVPSLLFDSRAVILVEVGEGGAGQRVSILAGLSKELSYPLY